MSSNPGVTTAASRWIGAELTDSLEWLNFIAASHPIASELGQQYPWTSHAHEHGKICLVVQGKYHERIGVRTIHYRPFHCLYHPPGFDHTDGFGESGMRLLSLSFNGTLFQEADSRGLDLTPLRDLTGRNYVWRILRLFAAIPSLLPVEIEAAAVDIIADIVSAPREITRARRSLLAARDFVIEN